jgi:cation:H+ antiporter
MLWMYVLLLAVGFAMLVKGADWFVEGSSGFAGRLGIPQIVIGLTIVAMGTSAPEAAVSINAALKGNADISVGNILGSNILNILIILGLTSVIVPLAIKRMTLLVEIPYMIFITAVFLAMGITGAGISRPEGALLLLLFVIYLTYLFILAKKSGTDNVIEGKPIWKLAMMMLAGIIAVVWGSDITVNAATGLARAAGLSERFIGLTIVALGTSLPELFTSVTAAVRGNADIAVGNIVGSNIFNILFIMGVAALAAPLGYGTAFVMDGAIAIMAGALLWLLALKRRRLNAAEGLVMLLVYGVYVAYLWIL